MEVVVNAEKINGKVSELLENLSMEIFSKSQENIVKNGSIDTGEMLKSGNIFKRGEMWIIHYQAPYSAYVEFGTQPHRMPIEPLKRWVKRKLGYKEKEAEKVSWAVWQKIAREGTDPKPFLRPAIREVLRKHNLPYKER